MPAVSVILPFHNAASTLKRAIASIQAQSFTDWELVALDDGSSDASADIADCVSQGSNDFYLVRIDQNGNLLWNTMHGGSTSDIGRSVALTAESGCLIAGYSDSTDIPGTTNSDLNDVFFIRVDENGGL